MRSVAAADRAVSEVLGFAFVFATVVLSVALVSATGYGGLDHARDAERVNNAATALDVLADNAADLAYAGAPSRSTELKLHDASLSIGDPVVEVVVYPADGSLPAERFELRPLVIDADRETALVYLSGAIVREDRGGTVTLRPADSRVAVGETTTMTLIDVVGAEETRHVGGSTTVNVRTTRTATDLVRAQRVEFTLTGSHEDVGRRYLEGLETSDCAWTGAALVCEWSGDRAYVTVVETEVRFD